MKRKVSTLILSVILLAGLGSATVIDDFEDGDLSEYSGDIGEIINNTPLEGQFSLKMEDGGGGTGNERSINTASPDIVKVWGRHTSGQPRGLMYLKSGSTNIIQIYSDVKSGTLNLNGVGVGSTTSADTNTTYVLREIDWDNNEVGEFLVNGVSRANNTPFLNNAGSVDALRFDQNSGSCSGCTSPGDWHVWDNIRFEQGPEPPVINSNTTRPEPDKINVSDTVDTVVNATDPNNDPMNAWVTVHEGGTEIVTDQIMDEPTTGNFQYLNTFTANEYETQYNVSYKVGDGTDNTTENSIHFTTPTRPKNITILNSTLVSTDAFANGEFYQPFAGVVNHSTGDNLSVKVWNTNTSTLQFNRPMETAINNNPPYNWSLGADWQKVGYEVEYNWSITAFDDSHGDVTDTSIGDTYIQNYVDWGFNVNNQFKNQQINSSTTYQTGNLTFSDYHADVPYNEITYTFTIYNNTGGVVDTLLVGNSTIPSPDNNSGLFRVDSLNVGDLPVSITGTNVTVQHGMRGYNNETNDLEKTVAITNTTHGVGDTASSACTGLLETPIACLTAGVNNAIGSVLDGILTAVGNIAGPIITTLQDVIDLLIFRITELVFGLVNAVSYVIGVIWATFRILIFHVMDYGLELSIYTVNETANTTTDMGAWFASDDLNRSVNQTANLTVGSFTDGDTRFNITYTSFMWATDNDISVTDLDATPVFSITAPVSSAINNVGDPINESEALQRYTTTTQGGAGVEDSFYNDTGEFIQYEGRTNEIHVRYDEANLSVEGGSDTLWVTSEYLYNSYTTPNREAGIYIINLDTNEDVRFDPNNATLNVEQNHKLEFNNDFNTTHIEIVYTEPTGSQQTKTFKLSETDAFTFEAVGINPDSTNNMGIRLHQWNSTFNGDVELETADINSYRISENLPSGLSIVTVGAIIIGNILISFMFRIMPESWTRAIDILLERLGSYIEIIASTIGLATEWVLLLTSQGVETTRRLIELYVLVLVGKWTLWGLELLDENANYQEPVHKIQEDIVRHVSFVQTVAFQIYNLLTSAVHTMIDIVYKIIKLVRG